MADLVIRPGYMLMGDFDTRNRYVRQVANEADVEFWVAQGSTVQIKVDKHSSGWSALFRYECGPRSVTPFSPYTNNAYAPAAGFSVSRAGSMS